MDDLSGQGAGALSFEDFRNENGITYWWASDLMGMLGYSDMRAFQKVLDRTTRAMVSLGIPHYENIIPAHRDGAEATDFKITRFACYMSAMNADPRKPEVARCQAYFAEHTRKFEIFIENGDGVERLLVREELADGHKSLSSAAKGARVTDYARFMDAGYLGMYNSSKWKLAKKRGLADRALFDHMGRAELAANLFRVTQTEGRIRNRGITGQANLEQAHQAVGREVRKIVIENTGQKPEDMPQEKRLPEIKKELKNAHRKMLKADGGNRPEGNAAARP